MDNKIQCRCEARARIIKAMAHSTRLFVVDELLRHGERCVCELTEMVGVDMSTMSRHLAILKSAGIVEDDKRGLQVFYRVQTGCIVDFLECVDSLVKRDAKQRREMLLS